jgi:hypothetical protein
MWRVLQVLIGNLFKGWNMLGKRFLRSNPADSAVIPLNDEHKRSLAWLKDYFWLPDSLKETPLRTVRDKTAFHLMRALLRSV